MQIQENTRIWHANIDIMAKTLQGRTQLSHCVHDHVQIIRIPDERSVPCHLFDKVTNNFTRTGKIKVRSVISLISINNGLLNHFKLIHHVKSAVLKIIHSVVCFMHSEYRFDNFDEKVKITSVTFLLVWAHRL